MLPFAITLRPGAPIYEQVIFAVTRAIVTGELHAGDPFPSVRALSQALKINPNTAHKIVASLIEQRILTARPGIGTVIAEPRVPGPAGRRELLEHEAEHLVVHAKQAGLTLQEVLAAIRQHWTPKSRRAG
jgi:GntR family transcriptional regulator